VIVAVDAMGGDYAPQEIVKGAIDAARGDGIEIILVGPEEAIRSEVELYDISNLAIHMVNSDEAVREGESPVAALSHQPDASVFVATRLVKEGEADAVISMGSTGATMVSAIAILGKFDGIRRPVMGGSIPRFVTNTMVFDLGGNVDCKPRELLNFAVIGSVVVRKMLHISNPTVALLSNGAEEGKGNKNVKDAYRVFKESDLNFIGNIEGHDIPAGKANVIICDGFVGNILLKFCEGLGDSIEEWLRHKLDKNLTQSEIDTITSELYTATHISDVDGGGIIYGVDGIALVGHGRSTAPLVAGAIRHVKRAVDANLLETLKSELTKIQGLEE